MNLKQTRFMKLETKGGFFLYFLLGRALLDMSPVSPLSTSLSSLFHVLN